MSDQANTKRRYVVQSHQLPLSCPTDDMRVWDSHPKVYLPIEKTGCVVCPYCDAEFVLEGHEQASPAHLSD